MNAIRYATMFSAIAAAALSPLAAQTRTAPSSRPPVTAPAVVAHYTANAPFDGDPGAAARIDILIERWSTDSEARDLEKAMSAAGPDALLQRVQSIRRRAGVLLIPGVQGAGARARVRHPVNLYFARERKTASGTQIVLVADHYLAIGKPTGEWPADFQASLLDIRMTADGTGVGKVASATALAANKATGALEVANFDAQPASLVQVQQARD